MNAQTDIELHEAALKKAIEEGRPQEDIEFHKGNLDRHLTLEEVEDDTGTE